MDVWDSVIVVAVVLVAAAYGVWRAARAFGLIGGAAATSCPSCGDEEGCAQRGSAGAARGARLVQLRRPRAGAETDQRR